MKYETGNYFIVIDVDSFEESIVVQNFTDLAKKVLEITLQYMFFTIKNTTYKILASNEEKI